MKRVNIQPIILIGILSILVLFINSCEQYEYTSPSPGIIEIRLKTKSENIDFSGLNNFVMSVSEVKAVRTDDAKLNVYQDLRAIRRENSTYNILQPAARDSNLVIGQAYAPPGDFAGINILMKPQGNLVLDGYRNISVVKPPENPTLDVTLQFRKPYSILANRTTVVTLTIDVDSSLVRGAEEYFFYPYYYISSINIY